jgi:hypothetical protein
MIQNWKFFSGAAVLAGYFMICAGAPPLTVTAGIALGAVLTYRATRSA